MPNIAPYPPMSALNPSPADNAPRSGNRFPVVPRVPSDPGRRRGQRIAHDLGPDRRIVPQIAQGVEHLLGSYQRRADPDDGDVARQPREALPQNVRIVANVMFARLRPPFSVMTRPPVNAAMS